MKRLSILGSTGSIGVNALRVVAEHPERFRVRYLSTFSKWEELVRQAQRWRPQAVAVVEYEGALKAREALPDVEVLEGREGLLELAGRNDVDLVLNAIVGGAGLEPTVKVLQAGVSLALANKESLVVGGAMIKRLLEKQGSRLIPVDSEHSAVWQCLVGEEGNAVERLLLTGSGGPFRTRPLESFEGITPEEALQHPNWRMGPKITVDSATMMNKGLEIIEAHWLFDLPPERIQVVIHPQSIIHSLVEFQDGSVKAQLGVPDMKIPIQYALTYPERLPSSWDRLDLAAIGTLTFEEPDYQRFPCVRLAYDALRAGGTAPAVLNTANDLLVDRFLKGKISFTDIPRYIEKVLEAHQVQGDVNLTSIREVQRWVPEFFKEMGILNK